MWSVLHTHYASDGQKTDGSKDVSHNKLTVFKQVREPVVCVCMCVCVLVGGERVRAVVSEALYACVHCWCHLVNNVMRS